eukprot:s2554_g8.t2
MQQSPLMRRIEGMIKAHSHGATFLKETTDYVKRFTLHSEFAYLLQMLSSNLASGLMMTCRGPNPMKNEQDIVLQVPQLNQEVAYLWQQLVMENAYRSAYPFSGGYPHYWQWPQPAARAKKSKKEKKEKMPGFKGKKNKKKEKRRSKAGAWEVSSYTYTEDESPSPRRLAAAKAANAAPRRRGTPQPNQPTTESMQERFQALLRDKEPQGPSSSPKRARPSTLQSEPEPKMSRENELELQQWLEDLDGRGNFLEPGATAGVNRAVHHWMTGGFILP